MRKKLNRYWRIFGTGFCFSYFGIGSLIIALSVFPVFAIFIHDKKLFSLAIRSSIKANFKFFVRMMEIFGLIDVKLENIELLEESHGKIIVANHPSLIDIVILISIVPQSDCIVKYSLGKNFFMRYVIKAAYILASPDVNELFKECERSMKQGNSMIIFPEGTRTVPGKPSKLSHGSSQMALRTGADILPVHIHCHPPGLLKHQKWYDVAESKMQYIIKPLPVIKVADYQSDNYHNSSRRLTEKIKEVLEIL